MREGCDKGHTRVLRRGGMVLLDIETALREASCSAYIVATPMAFEVVVGVGLARARLAAIG